MQRPIRLHYVASDSDRYRKFYSVIANPLIWFLQHYLWDLSREPLINARYWDAWEDGYVRVNHAVAERAVEVARELPRRPLILTQDYQLYLAPSRIRELLTTTPAVEQEIAGLQQRRPEKLIVRVDRTDPAKNIVRGFLAYERLLRQRPEWRRRVQFYAFLQPSRQDITVYRDYLASVKATAERINRDLGELDWEPIRLEFGENLRRAVAAYCEYDVLLVNPIYDGMNLVAKEGALLNRRDGVLVLSENAGAHEELGPWAMTINPFDV